MLSTFGAAVLVGWELFTVFCEVLFDLSVDQIAPVHIELQASGIR